MDAQDDTTPTGSNETPPTDTNGPPSTETAPAPPDGDAPADVSPAPKPVRTRTPRKRATRAAAAAPRPPTDEQSGTAATADESVLAAGPADAPGPDDTPGPDNTAPSAREVARGEASENAPADSDAQPVAETGTTPASRRPPRQRAARRKTASPFSLPDVDPAQPAPADAPDAQTAPADVSDAQPAPPDASDTGPNDPREPSSSAVGIAVLGEDEARDLIAQGGLDDTEDETPAAPLFGLVFQAPTVTAPPRRRRASTRPAGEADPKTIEGGDADAADADDTDVDSDPSEGGDAGRTRRRRGGKGRRRGEDEPSSGEGDTEPETDTQPQTQSRAQSQTQSQAKAQTQTQSQAKAQTQTQSQAKAQTHDEAARDHDSAGDEDDSDEESTSGRRRTRRRRRPGNATESEDPPGTVTRVREPRSDEATGIRGSTRLEAKKQRRREGREAGRRRTIVTEAEFLARRESVERVMVVRQRGERTQIAVLEDGVLVEHYVSREDAEQHGSMAGNIYLGRVQNVLPSMEAAFVDVGRGRNAVLYAGEVNWDAAGLERSKSRRIEHALSSGQGVLVQVTKDPIGHKGARLSSQISLPGRYLVYVPEGHMTGISRKLPDTERARLKKILRDVVPAEAGVIVRTAAEGATEAELRADVERLSGVWEIIQRKAKSANPPTLLHGEVDLTVRVIRDVFNEDFSRLVVSGDDACATVEDYLTTVAPDLQPRLEKWSGEADVFSDFRVDEQLAKAMDRKVWLPSGGSLVIDRTEAMTVIDVNTGKFVGAGGNLEETVTKNNVEAAEEIVHQLRLRDTGGIIVIDFIDMVLEANRDLVIRRLLECLGRDRTKHQVAEVTSLGLVQMTRKRVGAGLIELFSEPCEHCAGRGIIVHPTPVERQPEPMEDRRRGRRGRPGGTSVRGAGSSNDTGSGGAGSSHAGGAGEAPTPSTPSGPTPAQIAAAAFAALHPERRGSAAGADGHGGDGEAQPDEVTSSEAAVVGTTGSQLLQAPTVTTDLIHVRAGASTTAGPAHTGEAARRTSVPADASPEREREDSVPAPADRPRRRRGRATAPAGPPRADRDGPADGPHETTPEQG